MTTMIFIHMVEIIFTTKSPKTDRAVTVTGTFQIFTAYSNPLSMQYPKKTPH
jgi:hypothetical protein